MARQHLMTFVAAQKRWIKGYKGKFYSVSCKQLGAPATKGQSWLQANAWWEAKQQEIDAKERADADTPESRATKRVEKAMASLSSEEIHDLMVRGEMACQVGVMQAVVAEGKEVDALEYLVELEMKTGAVSKTLALASPAQQAAVGRSVAEQMRNWLAILAVNVRQNAMNSGRYESYERHINLFAKWIGAEKSVDVITATKLEEWYSALCVWIAERKYSPATVKTIFMTTRQFIGRLQEMGTIAPLGNLQSKRFRFGDGAKEVVRFSCEDTKQLITSALAFSRRTSLYILLGLNCGFYQNDIAELDETEVNWDEETITRPRSKIQSAAAKTTWKLWPETLELLKEFRAKKQVPNKRGKNRVILTEDGSPLVVGELRDNGKLLRYDVIQSAIGRLQEKTGRKWAFKHLRKTSASELGAHPVYAQYVQHFLAHSPKGMADRHYVRPDNDQFFAALNWLRGRFMEI